MSNGHEDFTLTYGRQFSDGGAVYFEVTDVSNIEKACQEALANRPKSGVSYYILCGEKRVQVLPGYSETEPHPGRKKSGGLQSLVDRLSS